MQRLKEIQQMLSIQDRLYDHSCVLYSFVMELTILIIMIMLNLQSTLFIVFNMIVGMCIRTCLNKNQMSVEKYNDLVEEKTKTINSLIIQEMKNGIYDEICQDTMEIVGNYLFNLREILVKSRIKLN